MDVAGLKTSHVFGSQNTIHQNELIPLAHVYHLPYLTNHLIFIIFMGLGHMSPLDVQVRKPRQRGVLQPILHSIIGVVSTVLHNAVVMGTETTYQTPPSYEI